MLNVLFRVEAGLLTEVGAHEVIGEVMRLAQQSVLRLEVFGQF